MNQRFAKWSTKTKQQFNPLKPLDFWVQGKLLYTSREVPWHNWIIVGGSSAITCDMVPTQNPTN